MGNVLLNSLLLLLLLLAQQLAHVGAKVLELLLFHFWRQFYAGETFLCVQFALQRIEMNTIMYDSSSLFYISTIVLVTNYIRMTIQTAIFYKLIRVQTHSEAVTLFLSLPI